MENRKVVSETVKIIENIYQGTYDRYTSLRREGIKKTRQSISLAKTLLDLYQNVEANKITSQAELSKVFSEIGRKQELEMEMLNDYKIYTDRLEKNFDEELLSVNPKQANKLAIAFSMGGGDNTYTEVLNTIRNLPSKQIEYLKQYIIT